MCRHTKFLDLVTHWQCVDCGRIVEKQTVDEALERADNIIDELHRLERLGVNISELASRIDAVMIKLNMPQYGKN